MKSLGDLWPSQKVLGIPTPICVKCGNIYGKKMKELKNHDEPVDLGYTLFLGKPKSYFETVPTVLLILMKMVSGGWFQPEYVSSDRRHCGCHCVLHCFQTNYIYIPCFLNFKTLLSLRVLSQQTCLGAACNGE